MRGDARDPAQRPLTLPHRAGLRAVVARLLPRAAALAACGILLPMAPGDAAGAGGGGDAARGGGGAAAVLVGAAAASAPARESRPGVYRGYSQERYDGHVLESRYVAVRDGTRLAVDIYRPALAGKAADGRFPVIWTHTPYRRAFTDARGRRVSAFDENGLLALVRHGYVLAAVDTRGRGASFGVRRGFQDRTEALDAYDMTEWFAAQPWSTGKVGITGCSYGGGSTFQAATVAPPSLKAIAPGCTDYDKYGFVARGGILAQFNTRPENPGQDYGQGVVPVAEDTDGKLAAEAIALHERGTPMAELWKGMPYRDDVSPLVGTRFWDEVSIARYRDVIEKSGVAIFLWGNFHDEGSHEAVLAFNDLRNPRKLWMGGFGHCQTGDFPMATELLRFFDRWLKDVDNGWDREPPVYYHVDNAPAPQTWLAADAWPLPATRAERLLLDGAAAATTPGTLAARAAARGGDAFVVDYAPQCRDPTDLYFIMWPCAIERHGLAWETPAFAAPRRMAGYPLADLWITASTPDADLFVYLEDVAPDGRHEIISHGRLRASLRAEQPAPYRNDLGLPWRRAFRADTKPLVPGEPARLRIDLLPVSTVVQAGHRLRLRVAGADPRQRFRTVSFDPAPRITVLRGGRHASSLQLPFVGPDQPAAAIAGAKAIAVASATATGDSSAAAGVGSAALDAASAGAARAATPAAVARGPVPVTAESMPFGAATVPGASGSIDLAARGYVEEEWFVSGSARRYAYDANWTLAATGDPVPYVTRVLVRKPADPRRFSGIVHLEPAHPVLGGASNWTATHDYLMRRGHAYVLAVVGEDALTRGGPIAPERAALRAQAQGRTRGPLGAIAALRAYDAARYAPLAWPDDDAARWDAFAQIAALLKRGGASGPLAGLRVRRLYASGWSFTGSLLRTFVNDGHHDRARDRWGRPLIDGYLVGISASGFISGYVTPTTGATVLPVGHPRRVTRDLDVPVIELMTENEAVTNTAPQPPENDHGPGRFRLYEVAGLSHGDGMTRGPRPEPTTAAQLRARGLGAPPQSDPCALAKSDVPMGALASAALDNLDAWVERGLPPPRAARIDFAGPRDEFGNRRGGVRVAPLDLPLARYDVPAAPAPPGCAAPGSPFLDIRRLPLEPRQLARTYRNADDYLARYTSRLDTLVAERWLLADDARAELAEARARATATWPAVAAGR